jgi:iduronate 2-sulfatase
MEIQTRMALARHGDIHFTQGLKRMRLGQASGKPWWVSIGNHRPHTTFRVPAGFHGTELYPNGTGDVVVPPKHPGPGVDIPWMSGNWQGGDISDPAHNIGQGSPSPVNGCPTCIIPDNRTVEYRRWYYAAVSVRTSQTGPFSLDFPPHLW